MYLNKTDFTYKIPDTLLRLITEADDTLIEDAVGIAQDTLKTYLTHYDLFVEFQKSGTDRNRLLTNWCVNIALYELMQRIADREVPQKIIKNYDDTINALETAARGKINLSLKPSADGNETPVRILRMGSRSLRDNRM